MRAEEFSHSEFIDLNRNAGDLRFSGARAILLDTGALGHLRQHLISTLGTAAARAILTRFGFVQGWYTAEAVRHTVRWSSDLEWRKACPWVHALEGYFLVANEHSDPMSQEGLRVQECYESQQHILHFGPSQTCTCWTVCGLLSGYLCKATGQEIHVFEDQCVAKGDTTCQFHGKKHEQWEVTDSKDYSRNADQNCREHFELDLTSLISSMSFEPHGPKSHHQRPSTKTPPPKEQQDIIAQSSPMKKLITLADRVAKTNATVLITGESGSGKERVARFLHLNSPRKKYPFLAINCGAMNESLLESELFGHSKGSFTGAVQDRVGLLEASNGGTLFLDEIGDISKVMQIKLLRVLEEREVRRVGENKNRAFDVRILAATNRDLMAEIEKEAFRADLYYRLKVIDLEVPSLRDRREDILPLARFFLARISHQLPSALDGFTPHVASALLRYPWPGNVRELRNVIERAAFITSEARIHLVDLPSEMVQAIDYGKPSHQKIRPLAEVERDCILAAMKLHKGSQAQTAKALGIGSVTLYRKLKRFNAEPSQKPSAQP